MQGIDQLAIDVELQLRMRGITDPDRLRAFIAGQPVGFPLQQAALARDAIHDLHVGGRTRRGAQQPMVPGQCFFRIAGVHQDHERKGGVAQPAEAIVPIAAAAELLRQRRGGRRDDAAGRRIGQRLQRDERAHHQIAALAVIGATAAPFRPEILGVLQGAFGIDRRRHGQMRRTVGQHERHAVAGANFEFGDRGQVFAVRCDRGAQHCHVRPGDAEQRSVVLTPHPGNVGAEAEPHHQLHPQLHDALVAAHNADHVGSRATRRHEVDQRDGAVSGLEGRLQDQRIAAISSRAPGHLGYRRDTPMAMLSIAEQRAEAGIGIEGRPTQPVD